MVAEANGGFLPGVQSSRLVQKKGEVVHLEVQATLLKDVAVRQSQGGYIGFSLPIGRTGIRYRIGGYRGPSRGGRHQARASRRRDPRYLLAAGVFIGNKKTVETPYSKLVNFTVFSDGVQFYQSNRQTAPVFLVSGPDVVSALVYAAAQRLNAQLRKGEVASSPLDPRREAGA